MPHRSAAVGLLWWFGCALAFTTILNEANLSFIRSENPLDVERNAGSTVFGVTIWSPDNSYYVTLAKNLVDGHGYVIDPLDPTTTVRRTPGYPLFLALNYALFGEPDCYLAARVMQVLLYALAAPLVGLAVLKLSGDAIAAHVGAALMALCPFTAIYTYYTITEAISPFWVAASLWAVSAAVKAGSSSSSLCAGFILGASVLTRPITGIALPAYAVASVSSAAANLSRLRPPLLLSIGVFAVLSPWAARTLRVTGSPVLLERYEDSVGFGVAFEAFRDWWRAWGDASSEPVLFAKQAMASLSDEDARKLARELAAILPPDAILGSTSHEVELALTALSQCLSAKARKAPRIPVALRHVRVPFRFTPLLPCETTVRERFHGLHSGYLRTAPIRYWIVTPLGIAKGLLFNSNSSAIGALHPGKGGLADWQILIKALLYFLNVVFWSFVLFLPLACRRRWRLAAIVGFPPLATIAYLSTVVRGGEARYLVPLYPYFAAAGGWILTIAARQVAGRLARHS